MTGQRKNHVKYTNLVLYVYLAPLVWFSLKLPPLYQFFFEHAGELHIFVLREEKEWSNYNSQHHTLDQSEGCSGLKRKYYRKKNTA